MSRPCEGIPKACYESFRGVEVDSTELLICRLADPSWCGARTILTSVPSGTQCLTTGFLPCLTSSFIGISALSLSSLQTTAGSSCGMNHLRIARNPIGAFRRRVLCSRRLSATPPGLCRGSPSKSRKNGCRGTAGAKADFKSMSCWASSLMSTSRLSMCALKGEWVCPFCSHMRPGVATTTRAPGMIPVQWYMTLS